MGGIIEEKEAIEIKILLANRQQLFWLHFSDTYLYISMHNATAGKTPFGEEREER